MKPFALRETDLVRVIASLIADELGRSAKRNVDSLTVASWDGQTALGADGAGLASGEWQACAARVRTFFGRDADMCPGDGPGSLTIGDWAREVGACLRQTFTTVTFTPAGRAPGSGDCPHAADQVFADAAAAANLFSGRRRVLSLVAPHSLLGFTLTVLAPNLLQVAAEDARGLTPDILRKALQFGDALVATPTLWRYMLNEGVTAPDNAMGVFFGEPMAADLSADMRQAGFAAQREIYGSTETGLVGWRDSPSDPFLLFDHWRRAEDALLRVGCDGAPVEPMDVLQWIDDRRFTLAGRRDGAVQVGAVNVFPDRIAEIVRQHADVADCFIRVGRYKDGSNRLIAHITLANAAAPTESRVRDIDRWCREGLRPQERPRIFPFEASLEGISEDEAAR